MLLTIKQDQKNACIELAKLIDQAGGRALLVGGCVRDSLLNIPAKDIDMEVYGLSAGELEQTLKKKWKN